MVTLPTVEYIYRPHTKHREGYVFSISVLLLTGGGVREVHSDHIVAWGGGRALCDICGKEHYFENRLGPLPLPPPGKSTM